MNPFARQNARHYALQALYQWQLSGTSTKEIEEQFVISQIKKKVDLDYFKEILKQVPELHSELDEHIKQFITRPFAEIDPIELAILRLSTYELAYRLDIPYKVVINESLNLTKKFGSVEGYKFVNSIIDAIAKRIRTVETTQNTSAKE